MRKFSLTNAAFTGEIFITYNTDGLLVAFDASETNVQPEHIRWLLSRMPRQITINYMAELLEFIAPSKCHLVEVAMDISFDTFWKLYGKMINRKRAEALYLKMSDADKFLCINSIKKYDRYLARINWRSKQDPDTYLRNKNYQTDWDKLRD